MKRDRQLFFLLLSAPHSCGVDCRAALSFSEKRLDEGSLLRIGGQHALDACRARLCESHLEAARSTAH